MLHNHHASAMNATQKSIIEGFLSTYIDSMLALNSEDSIKALRV